MPIVRANKPTSIDAPEQPVKKTIYDYEDYRTFLSDSFEQLRLADSSLTYRSLAQKIGFKSSGFLLMIMKGERNMAPKTSAKVSSFLKLNREETTFFENLVQFNQATSADSRQNWARTLLESEGFKRMYLISDSQCSYYANWYHIVIREMVVLPQFKEDARWISEALEESVSPAEVTLAISTLLELGLLQRSSEGKLTQTTPHVKTVVQIPPSFILPFTRKFHSVMILRAKEAIENIDPNEREISSITFVMGSKNRQKIKETIQRFRREILAMTEKDPDADNVYQLNLQLFPLLRDKKKP